MNAINLNIKKPQEKQNVYTLAERLASDLNCDPKQYPEALQKAALKIMELTPIEQNIVIKAIKETTTTTKTDIKEAIKAIKSADRENSVGMNELDRMELFISQHFTVRYNVVSNKFYMLDNATHDDEIDEFAILRAMRKNNIKVAINTLIEILKSPFTPKINPFMEYFKQLPPWDGVDYIGKLATYINTTDQGRFIVQLKKHLVRTVACALEEDFNKQAFILVGSEGKNNQNSGKTTLIRWLCPPALSDYYAEDLIGDKDTLTTLSSNFMINLDELANFGKKELAELKAIMSKDKINVRLPYDKRYSILPRRASFFGSTNEATFLNDLTGNVRWIAFKLDRKQPIDWNYSKDLEPDQIWMQAYHLFHQNYSYKLTRAEIEENERANQEFMNLPPEFELISRYFEESSTTHYDTFMTASDMVKFLTKISDNSLKFYPTPIGKVLRALGFEKKNHPDSSIKNQKGYYLKYTTQMQDWMKEIAGYKNPLRTIPELPKDTPEEFKPTQQDINF
jgi:predicted P-loop ATPase